MANSIKVVLFEDAEETRSEVLSALIKHLKSDGTAIAFEGRQFTESAQEKRRMYEDRLESILIKPPYDGATLLVADRDLSRSQDSGFGGLSVGAVITVSRRLSIPICSYARQPDLDDYEWRERWEEGHIVLRISEGPDELARLAVVVARGFACIASELPRIPEPKGHKSPARALAAVLGKPEHSEKIGLYSVGDQNRLLDITPGSRPDLLPKLTRFLGFWLWDSLLRYPGLLVNEVAAASHLNIGVPDYIRPEVRAVFQTATFCGPFADSKHPRWWRPMLDDLVSSANCVDGLELVRQKVDPKIDSCRCYVDPSKTAGYYCIIARKPVSLENSRGGLSWFPRGADLTRISNPKFEEYGPWLDA